MNESTGMLDLESLRNLVRTGAISTVITAFPDLYGRLMGKRFDANFFPGIGCPGRDTQLRLLVDR